MVHQASGPENRNYSRQKMGAGLKTREAATAERSVPDAEPEVCGCKDEREAGSVASVGRGSAIKHDVRAEAGVNPPRV